MFLVQGDLDGGGREGLAGIGVVVTKKKTRWKLLKTALGSNADEGGEAAWKKCVGSIWWLYGAANTNRGMNGKCDRMKAGGAKGVRRTRQGLDLRTGGNR